ncbi:hypothetical protein I553_1011 [Mycobacterium xenopi 4042]|uniref:Uncharacterized protein n=1 Tax=Mycobacterium xenopi 4042 TaxID=1299334 RepID=X7ZAK1_MYCXE|nr:hypothetical protein I553_1011 [Mycobacterium xenopi 4042]
MGVVSNLIFRELVRGADVRLSFSDLLTREAGCSRGGWMNVGRHRTKPSDNTYAEADERDHQRGDAEPT